jgi:hypothetical protein
MESMKQKSGTRVEKVWEYRPRIDAGDKKHRVNANRYRKHAFEGQDNGIKQKSHSRVPSPATY